MMIKKLLNSFSSKKSPTTTIMGGSNSKGATIQQKITPIFEQQGHVLFIEYEPGTTSYSCCYADLTEIPAQIFTSKNPKQPTTSIVVDDSDTTSTNNEEVKDSNTTTTTTTIAAAVLEENPYLDTMILDFNKITTIPESIGLLVNLKHLSLASNKLTEIPDHIAKLKNLVTLQVGLNPLEKFPSIICTIKTLTVLHLESNQITEIPIEFQQLVNLKTLSLMDNLLKTIPNSLPSGIEKLNLACNDIESTESESIVRLSESLITLNLLENQIKSIDESFSKLIKLQTLILDCNHLTEIPGHIISGMKSLVTLNLPHNNLSTLPAEIIKLPVKVIDVRGNPFEIIKSKPREFSSTSAFVIEDFILDKENLTRIQLEQLEVIINDIPEQQQQQQQDNNESNAASNNKNNNNNQRIIFWQTIIPDEIIDRLYLGCRECSLNKNWLRENNVTHILTVAHFKPLYSSIFKYKCINIDDVDHEDISKYFKDIVEFIEEGRKEGGVLVHCRAGVSRSATSVIAYLMTKNNITFQEAFNITSTQRPRICPNNGFTHQLKKYEESILENKK